LPPVHIRVRPNCRRIRTMAFTDFLADVWETFAHPSPDADAPVQGGSSTNSPASGTDEESGAEAEVNKQDAKSESESGEQGHRPSDDNDDEAEAEDEDEDEIVDPKETLEEGECAHWPSCYPRPG
jgi:ubiquinol-cytochrome c reductase subunit 6